MWCYFDQRRNEMMKSVREFSGLSYKMFYYHILFMCVLFVMTASLVGCMYVACLFDQSVCLLPQKPQRKHTVLSFISVFYSSSQKIGRNCVKIEMRC